ncbi:FHA domain-containing protein [Verrucomicrobiota bacterium sgz303538]
MAAIRIQLPGREEVSIVALRGAHITIGRSPANIFQVPDGTVSLCHAELIDQGGHYLLHDLGSTNGVFVNGQQVNAFHLRETCKLNFGRMECEFLTDTPADLNVPVETLPLQPEMAATQKENADLKAQLMQLEAELQSLKESAALQADTVASTASQEQHERVLQEREWLRGALGRAEADIATARMARNDLQRAFDEQKAVLERKPKQAELDALTEVNAQLKTQLEAKSRELETLQVVKTPSTEFQTSLHAEHSDLKNAHGFLQSETTRLKADRSATRRENSVLKARIEEQARELAAAQETQAALSSQLAMRVPLEEHQKIADECLAAKEAQKQSLKELALLKKNLAGLAADRETLKKTTEALRAELEKIPTVAELDRLRSANENLTERVKAFAVDVMLLRKERSTLLTLETTYVRREVHERLLAEFTAMKEAEQRRDAKLEQVNRQLAESLTKHDYFERTIKARESELEALKSRAATEDSADRHNATAPRATAHERHSSNSPIPSSRSQLEEALEKLGFVVRPLRKDAVASLIIAELGSSTERSDTQPPSAMSDPSGQD